MTLARHVQLADAASERNDHAAAAQHYGDAAKAAIDAQDWITARLHLKWAWVHSKKITRRREADGA